MKRNGNENIRQGKIGASESIGEQFGKWDGEVFYEAVFVGMERV